MKNILAGFLVLSLALNAFLWRRISHQASELKSAQASAGETEELRRQNKELQLSHASAPDSAAPDSRELIRLRNEVGLLRKKADEAEPLRAQATEAAQLRAQLATATQQLVTERTTIEAAKVKEQEDAQSNMCINNMKQIGLGARLWSGDHNDTFPLDLISMKNELGTPKILFCPLDTAAVSVTDWAQLNPASISYRYLNPGGTENEPEKPFLTCPIHGHVGLSDGSVHRKPVKN